ncbi:hypothetical protein [Chryseolinea lacunae]|uniref:Anti sigma-E protein RseA N-terminal domain-containing protein n=1 Tax=Chryseolinea lacunae TaxID=2801331 RepID=A0ABS1KWA1_9BACT|nr:hypothetical protein [Chryseolinea lacunae]MBL0742581.1 hypothetical protein [Chryseolinea lacunae]
MDSKNIEALLNKYWNCETTLEEEQQLRDFFRNGNVPEQWKETAAMFRYFEENKKKSLNDVAFDHHIVARMQPATKGKTARLFYNTMRIAAGVTVLLTATWFIRREVRKDIPQEVVDTYDDPKLAFEETKKALMMISKGFGTAESQAKKINMFNEAQEEIQRKKDTKL